MLQAFRVVTFGSTILFGIEIAVDVKVEYRKAFLISGVLFLAATVLQKFLGVA